MDAAHRDARASNQDDGRDYLFLSLSSQPCRKRPKPFKKPSAPSVTASSGARSIGRGGSGQAAALSTIACLANAIGEADKLLPAFRRRADDHQDALPVVFSRAAGGFRRSKRRRSAGMKDHASSSGTLVGPNLFQLRHYRARQARRILAEQGGERLLEVAGRDASAIEHRDQYFEALRAPCIGRQNRRAESDAPAIRCLSITHERLAQTAPISVMISRSGKWPWRTTRCRPTSVFRSPCMARKSATSALTACTSKVRAPSRRTPVSKSVNVPGCASLKTLPFVTGFHSLAGEVEALNTPTIRRLTSSGRHQFLRIARTRARRCCARGPCELAPSPQATAPHSV